MIKFLADVVRNKYVSRVLLILGLLLFLYLEVVVPLTGGQQGGPRQPSMRHIPAVSR